MPFLPLYLQQLGVHDVGEVAMWSGVSLGVTPAMTALLAPAWGRLSDRFGRKIMVERSLVSFICLMAGMAYATQAWHIFALRAVQGLFAGYGGIALTMAAESAPRERTAYAIGTVQTAQRLGPALGPIIGGVVAQIVGLRRAFLVTSVFYVVALLIVFFMYDERLGHPDHRSRDQQPVRFRSVLAFENFVLLMAVVFGLQIVDRSYGPDPPAVCRRARHAGRPGAARRRDHLLDRRGRRRVRQSAVRAAAAIRGRHGRSFPARRRLGAARRADLPPRAAHPLALRRHAGARALPSAWRRPRPTPRPAG